MSDIARGQSRIVIALDPAAQADADVRLLESVVAGRAHQLVGLFIEDTRMLACAQSALAREVAWSGSYRRLEPAALERQIRTCAVNVRQRFEAIAQRLGSSYEFQIARGDVIVEIERLAREADVLVVSVSRGLVGSRAWFGTAIHELARSRVPAALFIPTWPSAAARPVLVLLEGEAEIASALQPAARLARALGAPLIVAVSGECAVEVRDLRPVLGELMVEARSVVVPGRTGLAQAANYYQAAAVVLTARDVSADIELVRDMLRTTRSALMLVSAEHRDRQYG
jgi:hypothetical protein